MKKHIALITALALIGGTLGSSPLLTKAETGVSDVLSDAELTSYDIGYDDSVSSDRDKRFVYEIYDGYAVISGISDSSLLSAEELTLTDSIRGVPVVSLTDTALAKFKKLKRLTLSANTRFLTRDRFFCDTLEEVIVPEDNPYFTVKDGVLYSADMKALIGPVSAKGVSELSVPKVTEKIAKFAFAQCNELTEATIPDNIYDIEEGAFAGCENLEKVTLPSELGCISHYTFANCPKLSEVSINSELHIIGSGAFSGCTALTDFTVPDSVDSVSIGAFENAGCVETEDGIRYVGRWAVGTEENILHGNIREGTVGTCEMLFSHNEDMESLTVPESVKHMGRWLVSSAGSRLERADFYNSVISYNALGICKHLKSVWIHSSSCNIAESPRTLPKYWEEPSAEDDISAISAFTEAPEKHETMICGSGAKDYALLFGRKLSLIDKDIPRDSQDTTYVVKDGIEYAIDKDGAVAMLRTDPAQKDVVLVDEVDGAPVTRCSNLLSLRGDTPVGRLSLPADFTASKFFFTDIISDVSFYEVDEDNQKFTAVDGILYSKDMTTLIRCPRYYGKTEVVIPEGVKNIDGYAFCGCENIEKVVLPEGVEDISIGAFRASGMLKETVLPHSLKRISASAFAYCNELTDLTLPDSLEYIGSQAFKGTPLCENEDGIDYIGDWAVGFNANAHKLIFREGTKHIAYMDTASAYLTKIVLPYSVESEDLYFDHHNGNPETLIVCNDKFDLDDLYCTRHVSDVYFFDPSCSLSHAATTQFRHIPNTSEDRLKTRTEYAELIQIKGLQVYFTEAERARATYIVIHGYKGSTAEEAANELGLPFVPIDGDISDVRGDVNFDGALNVADLVIYSKYLRGGLSLRESQLRRGDLNDDGTADIFDMISFRRSLLGV